MRAVFSALILAAAVLLASAPPARAAGSEPPADLAVDPAPCVAAAAADDDERIIASCGALIDQDKTPKPDRIKALIARAGAFARKDITDRAIADYDVALRLDPAQPDLLNARGELWRKQGDRRRALADFAAALRLNRDHAAARDNHKSLAYELERLGAQKAVAGKPSFDCARARRAVEKAICRDPELADLDREIEASRLRVLQDNAGKPAVQRTLQREHDAFVATRNASFGRRDYDLRQAMKARLKQLVGSDGY